MLFPPVYLHRSFLVHDSRSTGVSARQSVCSVISLDSSMSRTSSPTGVSARQSVCIGHFPIDSSMSRPVGPHESQKMDAFTLSRTGLDFPFHFSLLAVKAGSGRMIVCVVRLSPFESIPHRAYLITDTNTDSFSLAPASCNVNALYPPTHQFDLNLFGFEIIGIVA